MPEDRPTSRLLSIAAGFAALAAVPWAAVATVYPGGTFRAGPGARWMRALTSPARSPVAEGRRPLVLVADDDTGMRMVVRVNLELEGYEVREAADVTEARGIVESEPVVLVLLDRKLQEVGDGDELGRTIAQERPGLPVIVMSGTTPPPDDDLSWARASLVKPFDLPDMIGAVNRALDRSSER